MKNKGPMPESVKNFWRIVVKGEVTGEGEDIISVWERHTEEDAEISYHDVLTGIYKLTEDDIVEIRAIVTEYNTTREEEEAERERRRLSEEEADRAMANHYADRIRKIVFSRPNQFLPKISTPKRSRGN